MWAAKRTGCYGMSLAGSSSPKRAIDLRSLPMWILFALMPDSLDLKLLMLDDVSFSHPALMILAFAAAA